MRVLCDHKEQQQSDLEHTRQMRNILTDTAENLAVKYEDAQDKQQQITNR